MRDKDLGYAALKKRIEQLNAKDAFVNVGFFDDHEDNPRDPTHVISGTEASVAFQLGQAPRPTNLEVAVYNEFGTRSAPARPFLRTTFDTLESAYELLAGQLVDQVVKGNLTVKRALGLMGAKFAADTKNTIKRGVPPENAPSTSLRKGSSKPLVDTGQLIDSITWQVGPSKGAGNE